MIKGGSTKQHKVRGGELFPTLVVSCQASVVRGEEAGRFHEVAGVYIVAVACLRSAVDTSTVESRVNMSSFNITSLLQILRSYTLILKPLVLTIHALTRQCIVGKLNFSQNIKGSASPQSPCGSYATVLCKQY